MKRTSKIWLAAGLATAALAVLAVAYLRPGTTVPVADPTAAAPLVAPVPLPAPAAAAHPAPAPAPASPSRPFDEQQFIEVSATILIRVAQVQDRPDAPDLVPAIMARSLQDAGVKEEDFQALGEKIHADPARSKRVADAILKRVEQRATPTMRMKITDLAKAMQKMQRPPAPNP